MWPASAIPNVGRGRGPAAHCTEKCLNCATARHSFKLNVYFQRFELGLQPSESTLKFRNLSSCCELRICSHTQSIYVHRLAKVFGDGLVSIGPLRWRTPCAQVVHFLGEADRPGQERRTELDQTAFAGWWLCDNCVCTPGFTFFAIPLCKEPANQGNRQYSSRCRFYMIPVLGSSRFWLDKFKDDALLANFLILWQKTTFRHVLRRNVVECMQTLILVRAMFIRWFRKYFVNACFVQASERFQFQFQRMVRFPDIFDNRMLIFSPVV